MFHKNDSLWGERSNLAVFLFLLDLLYFAKQNGLTQLDCTMGLTSVTWWIILSCVLATAMVCVVLHVSAIHRSCVVLFPQGLPFQSKRGMHVGCTSYTNEMYWDSNLTCTGGTIACTLIFNTIGWEARHIYSIIPQDRLLLHKSECMPQSGRN